MSTSDEQGLFTMQDAAQIISEQHCNAVGHDIMWIRMCCDWWPQDGVTRYGCMRCQAAVSVVYPVDLGPPEAWTLSEARTDALRRRCTRPTDHELARGHRPEWNALRIERFATWAPQQPEQTYFACADCDALICVPHDQTPYRKDSR